MSRMANAACADDQSTEEASGWRALLDGVLYCVVFAVPCAVYAILLLHHFYIQGGFFLDSGLQAALIWHNDAALTPPLPFGTESFYATHMSPLFVPLGLLSRALPFTLAQYYAVVSGIAHAIPGLLVFRVLRRHYGGTTATSPSSGIRAAALGLAFAFNGMALAIIRYPHLEIIFVAGAMAFLTLLVERRWALATLCFVASLATREDAGFHLFALLATFLVVGILARRWGSIGPAPSPAPIIGFAAAALLYSVVALLIQHRLFPDSSSLGRIYLGQPPFAHVTAGGLAIRLIGYLLYRPYLVLPAIGAALGATRLRNPLLLFGYAAFLPWFALHLLAESDIAGTLSGYYGFPFMIAAFCPLIGGLSARVSKGTAGPAPDKRVPWLFAAMILLSWVGLGRQYNPDEMDLLDSLAPPSLQRQRATEAAVADLVACRPSLGRLAVDNAILGLAPRAFPGPDRILSDGGSAYDTVIYFENGFDRARVREQIGLRRLSEAYRIEGTSIRVASDRDLLALCRLDGAIATTAPVAAAAP